MTTSAVAKKQLLQWFQAEFSLKGDTQRVVRKLMQSSILDRLHFLRTVNGKKYGIYVFIGDTDFWGSNDLEVEEYEQMTKTYINGQKTENLREFFDAILLDRDAPIYIQLDYDNSEYCPKLSDVIEPVIAIDDLIKEVKSELEKRKEKFKQIDELIDQAIDDRNWERVKEISARKQMLLKDEPLM